MASFSKELRRKIESAWKESNNVSEVARKLYFDYNPDGNKDDIDTFRRSISKYLDREKLKVDLSNPENTVEFKEAKKRDLKESKYYIITWEQNNTPLHERMWKNVLAYKKFLGAELSVILGRYKNPTSIFVDRKNEVWNLETRPYWDAKRHDIHPHLSIVSDIKIQPTRKYPLRGIKDFTRNKSVIVGHPTLHLNPEPILNEYPHQILATTGAITVPNYTDSTAGAIGKENHKLGFVIVEIRDEEVFFVRQVEADDNGDFIDLCHKVTDGKVEIQHNALALIAEPHYPFIDKKMNEINDTICERYNVEHYVMHDVVDGESCNNHIERCPIEKAKRFVRGEWSIDGELEKLGDWLETKLQFKPVIVRSNHNDRFDRILDNDWRKDIPNSLYYLEYAHKAITGEMGDEGVVNYYLRKRFGDKVVTLDYTDSFNIGKYEVSQHGHIGANGMKGTPTAFRNLGIPAILGHTHSPYRMNDCIYIGTSTPLRMGYNRKGMSSWMSTNVLIAENGIAQQLFIIDGEYTTFSYA